MWIEKITDSDCSGYKHKLWKTMTFSLEWRYESYIFWTNLKINIMKSMTPKYLSAQTFFCKLKAFKCNNWCVCLTNICKNNWMPNFNIVQTYQTGKRDWWKRLVEENVGMELSCTAMFRVVRLKKQRNKIIILSFILKAAFIWYKIQ